MWRSKPDKDYSSSVLLTNVTIWKVTDRKSLGFGHKWNKSCLI